jgi:ABC-type glycerol-3-phosphate transport system substrate-binding protein
MAEVAPIGTPVWPPLLRRALLTRGGRLAALALAPLGAGTITACARPATPRRPLAILAERSPDREARIARWNLEVGTARGTPLELHHVPYGVESADTRAAIAAGVVRPDLLWGDLQALPSLSLAGLLTPLAPRVRRDRFDLKRFMPAALGPAFGPDGHLVALPDEVDARQLYFNRDHFQAAGLDPRAAGFDFERPATTWEGLRRANLELAAALGPAGRTPFLAGHEGAPLELWGWQNGATWLDPGARRADFTQPAAVAALAWLTGHARELANADRAAGSEFPPVSRFGDATDEPAGHPFLRAGVSICVESTRFVSTIAGWDAGFPLGYVELPRRAEGRPLVSLSRAWGYALHRDAPDGAWDALRFLLGEAAILTGAAAGSAGVPRQPDAGQDGAPSPPPGRPLPVPGQPLWYPPYSGQLAVDDLLAERHLTGSKTLDEARDHGLEQLRHARFRPPCPAPDAVWPLLAEALRQTLRGAPPAEALGRAKREAQTGLDSAWRSAASR